MTDELGSSARALLDAAREGMSPDAAAIQRMRSKIDLAVGGAVAGGAASATGFSLAAKLGIVAMIAAVATGGYLVATRERASAPRPVVQTTAPAPRETPSPTPAPVQVAAIEQPAPTVKPVATIKTARPAAKPPTEHVLPPDDMTSGQITPKRKPITLAREVELVDRSMAALRQGDPREALVALRTYATETAGSGQLAEDAAAIEIEALCKLADSTVPTKLAAFDKRWPDSAQRSRLTTKCP
ncbi:MAG TPA: hypothetical protein VIU61_06050 [Kofleriaceae bacterium]